VRRTEEQTDQRSRLLLILSGTLIVDARVADQGRDEVVGYFDGVELTVTHDVL
jgi:hypothetical protein